MKKLKNPICPAMKDIYPTFDKLIGRKDKELFLSQKAKTIWFTGLSGSGKSIIAEGLEKMLFAKGYLALVLDGDKTRAGFNKDLGFELTDRRENIRRVAEVSKLINNCGLICINSFISPTNEIRNLAENIIGADNFILIYVNTPRKVCEERDIKGLYKKARQGKIKNFTGIDSPFEAPTSPALKISAFNQTMEESILKVFKFVTPKIKMPSK